MCLGLSRLDLGRDPRPMFRLLEPDRAVDHVLRGSEVRRPSRRGDEGQVAEGLHSQR